MDFLSLSGNVLFRLLSSVSQVVYSEINGSKEFIDVSDIGVFLTSYKKIVSDKLENVIYDNSCKLFNV